MMANSGSSRWFCGQKRMYLKTKAAESVVGHIWLASTHFPSFLANSHRVLPVIATLLSFHPFLAILCSFPVDYVTTRNRSIWATRTNFPGLRLYPYLNSLQWHPSDPRCNVTNSEGLGAFWFFCKHSCNPGFPCILCLCDTRAWQLMILYSIPLHFLVTQAPILVWFDSTIIDISTILVTMYYSRYVGLWLVAVHGD